jgi:Protein kinase domain
MNELKTVSNKNLLIQNPRLSLNLSEKFISNTISPRLKKTSTILTPNGSFLKSLKTLKLEKKPSTKLIVSSSKKLSYENSIAQLKLPTTPDIVINTIPNLPNWIKQDLIEYEQIYYISKKEKSCVPYNDFSEEFNANIGDDVLYRYEILDVLGKGSFGQVFKVLDHATGNTLALKVIKNKQVYLEQSIIEIEILKYLHEKNNNAHSNFVKFEGNFYFRNHMVKCI